MGWEWHLPIWHWLARTAPAGALVLGAGTAAAMACRQPSRRLRVLAWTTWGMVLAASLPALPGLPRWGPSAPGWETPPADPRAVIEAATRSPSPRPGLPPRPSSAGGRPAPARGEAGRGPTPAVGGGPGVSSTRPVPASLVAVVVYLVAAGGLAAWRLVGLFAQISIRRSARAAPEAVRAAFRRVARPRGEGVRLLVGDRVAQPSTLGPVRPTILIPADWARDADPGPLGLALAHVRRGDLWLWHLSAAVQVVFVYLPPLAWARRQARLCQDILADAEAAASAGSALDYASFLIEAAGRPARRGLAPAGHALGLGGRGSDLTRRVTMLLNIDADRRLERRPPRPWTLGLAVGAIAWASAASTLRLDAAPPRPPAPASSPSPALPQAPAARAPAEGLTFAGKVADAETGRPVEGAEVLVLVTTPPPFNDHRSYQVIRQAECTTDALGSFRFEVPREVASRRENGIRLRVSHPTSYAPLEEQWNSIGNVLDDRAGGRSGFLDRLRLRPAPTWNLVGRVVDRVDGRPIAGARARVGFAEVRDPDHPEISGTLFTKLPNQEPTTGADGSFRFVVPPAVTVRPEHRVTITLQHPSSYAYTYIEGDVGSIREAQREGRPSFVDRLTMERASGVTGQVVDPDGRPIARAWVSSYVSEHGDSYRGLHSTATDAEGRFRIAPSGVGDRWFISVRAGGFAAARRFVVEPSGDAGRVVLRPGRTIRGRLLGPDGLPMSGYLVEAAEADGTQPDFAVVHLSPSIGSRGQDHPSHLFYGYTTTDADGAFRIANLPPATYDVRPFDPDPRFVLPGPARPLPKLYIPRRVAIAGAADPAPVELRPVPSVKVEARFFHYATAYTSGASEVILRGRLGEAPWHARVGFGGQNSAVIEAPKGLEDATLDLLADEAVAIRSGRLAGGPREGRRPTSLGRVVALGRLVADVRDVWFYRYDAPVVLLTVRARDGGPLADLRATASYAGERSKSDPAEVLLSRRPGGQFRTVGLVPDEDVALVATARGCRPGSATLRLGEGMVRELVLVLDRE